MGSQGANSIAAFLGRGIATALDAVALLASALVTGLMVFLVVARYLLGLSVVGLHELILLFAVQLYMAGALIASRRRTHLTVDWLSQRLTKPRSKAWHDGLIAVLTLTITLFFVAWAYWMLAWGIKRPQTTPAMGIPLWVPQLAIIVGAVGCTAYAARDLLRAFHAIRASR